MDDRVYSGQLSNTVLFLSMNVRDVACVSARLILLVVDFSSDYLYLQNTVTSVGNEACLFSNFLTGNTSTLLLHQCHSVNSKAIFVLRPDLTFGTANVD